MEDLGQRLFYIRNLRGLTQEKLSQKTGISTSTINNYESGTKKPKADYLTALVLALDTSADFLLGIEQQLVVNTDGLTDEQLQFLEEYNNALCRQFRLANCNDDKNKKSLED